MTSSREDDIPADEVSAAIPADEERPVFNDEVDNVDDDVANVRTPSSLPPTSLPPMSSSSSSSSSAWLEEEASGLDVSTTSLPPIRSRKAVKSAGMGVKGRKDKFT